MAAFFKRYSRAEVSQDREKIQHFFSALIVTGKVSTVFFVKEVLWLKITVLQFHFSNLGEALHHFVVEVESTTEFPKAFDKARVTVDSSFNITPETLCNYRNELIWGSLVYAVSIFDSRGNSINAL